ncbi:MAG: winged helix-turn-helix transcriptional regulator [Candidatus Omnitrophica bacterium]|nr:winged helix-turn-helix transcriptional regulator [Candidatus Omnitrophota bacterium]
MDEREFELINIIGMELRANQRDLSRQMNLSLGMTNMLIRRLITKGYIRIKQLNKKKMEYLLTPKGFSEKLQKSVKYTVHTINAIGLVRRGLSILLQAEYKAGVQKFYLLGGSDLAGLVEEALREQCGPSCQLIRIEKVLATMTDGVVLLCRELVPADVVVPEVRVVNVIEELAKHQLLATQALAMA